MARSWPNGFSITSRRKPHPPWPAVPPRRCGCRVRRRVPALHRQVIEAAARTPFIGPEPLLESSHAGRLSQVSRDVTHPPGELHPLRGIERLARQCFARAFAARCSRKASSENAVRETPRMRASAGSRPFWARLKRAGTSFREVRSPDALKMTTVSGVAMRTTLSEAGGGTGSSYGNLSRKPSRAAHGTQLTHRYPRRRTAGADDRTFGLSAWRAADSPRSVVRAAARPRCARTSAASSTTIQALYELVKVSDVVTFEFENVPVETARWLADRVPVYPPPRALEVSQERLAEKSSSPRSASRRRRSRPLRSHRV